MKGKFIVFEGCEGSGKTTHSKLLAEKLINDGYDVIHTQEPGGSPLGLAIRELLLHFEEEKVQPRAELLLFLANRAQHVEGKILPAIEEGKIVICDRFTGSTLAYQVGARNLPQSDFIVQMEEYARAALQPDMVVYLEVEPAVGLERKRTGTDRITRIDQEELNFHEAVHDYFRSNLIGQENWVEINSAASQEENEQNVYNTVKEYLGL